MKSALISPLLAGLLVAGVIASVLVLGLAVWHRYGSAPAMSFNVICD